MVNYVEQGLINYPPSLTEPGNVFATGLNDFGQLGVSDNKIYSTVWCLDLFA